jgi:hypothetical protein
MRRPVVVPEDRARRVDAWRRRDLRHLAGRQGGDRVDVPLAVHRGAPGHAQQVPPRLAVRQAGQRLVQVRQQALAGGDADQGGHHRFRHREHVGHRGPAVVLVEDHLAGDLDAQVAGVRVPRIFPHLGTDAAAGLLKRADGRPPPG